MKRARVRDHASSILVAALSSAFGVLLLEVTAAIRVVIEADKVSDHESTAILLMIAAFIFLIIAVYVGALVTTNTFATIIAGRTRTIALLRLIGSSARQERQAVTREGLFVGVLGSIVGALAGLGFTWVLITVAVSAGVVPSVNVNYLEPVILIPIIVVALATWVASWVGSRRVLHVTPLQAFGVSQERSANGPKSRASRFTAITLFVLGAALLVLGVVVGLVSIFGVLLGLIGGILSFTGLILGAHIVMPPALRFVGRLMGKGAEATLASANAVRHPERSSRMTIGLVIGVTLITMFAVATQTFQDMVTRAMEVDPMLYGDIGPILSVTVGVFTMLIGVSAFIAGVGMVNNMSLSVLQRQRELGLLRALGFSGAQVRRMIILESAQYTLAALGVGLVLGAGYGWAGAQSLLGSMEGIANVYPPGVPWVVIGVLVVASAVLTIAASVAPARKATRIAPVAALTIT